MLYDPKWENKTKEPSLAGLAAWLEEQNPSTEYQWCGHEPCLIEQYCYSMGLSNEAIYGGRDKSGDNLYLRIVGGSGVAVRSPSTFGAALERARAALR